METRYYKVFKFDELSEEGKEKAIEKFREHNLDYEWYDGVYEDAEKCGEIMGIDVDKIYFSGFWSQGDGACFEGSYQYRLGSVKKIREYAPQDETLYRLAADLSILQKTRFYKLTAYVKQKSNYSHENCTEISVYDSDGDYADADTDEALSELLRGFMRWIYERLEQEYGHLQSDECIIETLKANEYVFTEDGSIN